MQLFTDSAIGRGKSPSALKTISEASEMLDVPQHVLRFWETKFTQIKPLKRNGGRRFYRPEDIEVLQQVKHLLYRQGYTIKGAKKAFEKKTVEELRAEFSPVALGDAGTQDNDNYQPAPAANAAPAQASLLMDVPVDAAMIAQQLRALSAELRAAAKPLHP